MIQSHPKGIYKGDNDATLVVDVPEVEEIASELDRKVAGLEYGFASFYPTVIREYFGGMTRHFVSVRRRLRKRAVCAYVVGDQCSYLQVFVPTAWKAGSVTARSGLVPTA
jgi:hypothetical protein